MVASQRMHQLGVAAAAGIVATSFSWSRKYRDYSYEASTSRVQRSMPSAACEEAESRFMLVKKDKYLQSKKAVSTVYFEAAGGMRCCDLKLGNGKVAERGLMVGIHFEGFRLNGRQIESSWTTPNPLYIEAGYSPDFPALGEGVLGMTEGGRRELIVPPSMNRTGTEEVTFYKIELCTVSSQMGTGASKLQMSQSETTSETSSNSSSETDSVAKTSRAGPLRSAWRWLVGSS
eukprot:TRINITY_DN26297_c0_g1_i1.p1 TRINITY_DN26297_c0_g1~~TRINITY_DN26297_c0_g1_i1.p1  ORF type:complete len:232 (-),score=47.05 TRINITY_DN26297_c0_g1_i1:263-958(-)